MSYACMKGKTVEEQRRNRDKMSRGLCLYSSLQDLIENYICRNNRRQVGQNTSDSARYTIALIFAHPNFGLVCGDSNEKKLIVRYVGTDMNRQGFDSGNYRLRSIPLANVNFRLPSNLKHPDPDLIGVIKFLSLPPIYSLYGKDILSQIGVSDPMLLGCSLESNK